MSKENIYLDGIDKEFLEGNVEYAKSLSWQESDGSEIDDHVHCTICMRPMKQDDGIRKFSGGGHFIDEYCFELFIGKIAK